MLTKLEIIWKIISYENIEKKKEKTNVQPMMCVRDISCNVTNIRKLLDVKLFCHIAVADYYFLES